MIKSQAFHDQLHASTCNTSTRFV